MYMDDVLDSCEATDEARTLQRQLAVMLSDAAYNSRKWLSNDLEVIEEIPCTGEPVIWNRDQG